MAMNKQRFITGNSLGALRVDVGLEFHSIVDYDRKKMRKALAQGGNMMNGNMWGGGWMGGGYGGWWVSVLLVILIGVIIWAVVQRRK